jgi:murein DD-endopeptidase MepM/ murein hydrolase activator NlpD
MPLPARRQPLHSAIAVVLVVVTALSVMAVGHALADPGTSGPAGTGTAGPTDGHAALDEAPGGQWGWPLPPPHVVIQGFAPPAQPWLPGQRGVVLLGSPGEVVLAAGAGTVAFAGQVGGVGVVSLQHGDLRTTYEPVHPAVHTGESVSLGQRIGRLVSAGSECAPRTCLHWGLLRGADYLDPLSLLDLAVLRLLPLPGG